MRALLLLSLFCSGALLRAQGTVSSVTAGAWTSAGTRDCACVPQTGDTIVVQHSVGLPSNVVHLGGAIRITATGALVGSGPSGLWSNAPFTNAGQVSVHRLVLPEGNAWTDSLLNSGTIATTRMAVRRRGRNTGVISALDSLVFDHCSFHNEATISSRAITPLNKDVGQSAIAHGTAIGDTLAKAAIRAHDGSATWLGFTFDFASQRYGFSPLKLGLYDGVSGVSIFFAGLARQTGRQDFRELALAGLASARTAIQRETLADDIGCSLSTGAAGVCFALSVCAELLDEEHLSIEAAKLITSALPIAALASPTDLLGGAPVLLSASAKILSGNDESALRTRLVGLA